jgi:hypothetical protein
MQRFDEPFRSKKKNFNFFKVCSCTYHLSHDNILWSLHLKKINLTKQEIRTIHLFYKKSSEERLYEKTTLGITSLDSDFSDGTENPTEPQNEQIEENNQDIIPELDEFQPDELPAMEDEVEEEEETPEDEEKKLIKSRDISYLNFRKQKLQIPYIRKRLIKVYGENVKKKYKYVLKWINLLKALTCSTFFIFLTFLSIRMDDFIIVPWFLIFIPLMITTFTTMFIIVVLWTPSLQWPVTFYRWVCDWLFLTQRFLQNMLEFGRVGVILCHPKLDLFKL